MPIIADTPRVIPGIDKRGNSYSFRANIPGSKGKQRRVGGFPTQEAAYRARIQFLSGKVPSSYRTVGGWCAEVIEIKRESRRTNTANSYAYHLSLLSPDLDDILLEELTANDVRQALRKLVPTHATATIRMVKNRLQAVLRMAVNEGYITRCVTNLVDVPHGKPGRPMVTLSFDEVQRFNRCVAGQRDAPMWGLWITTGMRRGEVCGLRWEQVNLDRREILVNWQRVTTKLGIEEGEVKTKASEANLPIAPRVADSLRAWKVQQAKQRLAMGAAWQGEDKVFTTADGQVYNPNSLRHRLAVLCERAGVRRVTPHQLRHTYASRSLEGGVDIKLVSEMLRHERIETTMNLYQHVSSKQMHDVAEKMADRLLS